MNIHATDNIIENMISAVGDNKIDDVTYQFIASHVARLDEQMAKALDAEKTFTQYSDWFVNAEKVVAEFESIRKHLLDKAEALKVRRNYLFEWILEHRE